MIDINKEAEEYSKNTVDSKKSLDLDLDTEIWISGASFWGYLQGATKSKHVQAKIIQAQIDENNSLLEMLKIHGNERCIYVVRDRIGQLEKQLKQLENEIQ